MRYLWFLIFSATLAPATVASEIEVAAGAEYFQWQEFNDSGRKLLEETGPRYFIGVKGTDRLENDWLIDFGWRFYSGTVDYDGETLPPNVRPVTTETDYNGFRTELGFSNMFDDKSGAPDATWLLRFALGVDYWRRSLQNTTLQDGTIVIGYVERYTTAYAKIGASYQSEGMWSLGIGAKAPLYTREEVGLNGGITLNPEGQLSLFADMDIPLNRVLSVAVAYDSYRFAKSDPEAGYQQPESTQDTVGLSLRYRF